MPGTWLQGRFHATASRSGPAGVGADLLLHPLVEGRGNLLLQPREAPCAELEALQQRLPRGGGGCDAGGVEASRARTQREGMAAVNSS